MEKPKIVEIEDTLSNMKGTVLFEGNAYTNISLSDSVSDFDLIKIFYKNTNYNVLNSVEVTNDVTKTTLTSCIRIGEDLKMCSKTINVSGTSITTYSSGSIYVSAKVFSPDDEIAITKVIGYKYSS